MAPKHPPASMDPGYPQSSSPASGSPGFLWQDIADPMYEPRPPLINCSCNPPSYYPYCGNPLAPLPTLYTAVSYSPVNIYLAGDDRHPLPEVRIRTIRLTNTPLKKMPQGHGSLVGNSPIPTGMWSEQSQVLTLHAMRFP